MDAINPTVNAYIVFWESNIRESQTVERFVVVQWRLLKFVK